MRKFAALLMAALNGSPSAVRVVPDVKTSRGSAPGPMNLLTLGAI